MRCREASRPSTSSSARTFSASVYSGSDHPTRGGAGAPVPPAGAAAVPPTQEVPTVADRPVRARLEDRADLGAADALHLLEREPDTVGHVGGVLTRGAGGPERLHRVLLLAAVDVERQDLDAAPAGGVQAHPPRGH